MKKIECDAIVVGGGPAGSTAAAFLAKAGHSVVLVERDRFPRYHIGESLLPSTTLGILGKLGLTERLDAEGFPRKQGGTFVWGGRKEPWSFKFYRTAPEDERLAGGAEFLHSYQVERSRFDQILLERAEELGATVHQEARLTSLDGVDNEVKAARISTKDGAELELLAPFVVDGSGRNSPVRTLFGERHYDPLFKNVAIFRYYDDGGRLPGDLAGNVLSVSIEGGWFWYIPLANGLTSVGVVVARTTYDEVRDKTDPTALFELMVSRAPAITELLQDAKPCDRAPYDRVRTDADYSYIHSTFTHNGVFLAGDSACFIDPIFSSGVHLASYAGFLAADLIGQLKAGSLSWDAAAQAYEDAYRREYSAFYRFLLSFYELSGGEDTFRKAAHEALGDEAHSPADAFIQIVSGQATAGTTLFQSGQELKAQIAQGAASLDLLADAVNGAAVDPDAVQNARSFMMPIHEGRHRIARDGKVSGETESG